MIINTGNRTDIPAFYSEWFYNRIHEGFVYVRNPFDPHKISKFVFDQSVDLICFCTKNPKPMLQRWEELPFPMFWFVTITGYGKDIEPYVENKHKVLDSFIELSNKVGSDCIVWRYDPILLHGPYDIDYHKRAFETMAKKLSGYTHEVIVSFVDLYQKTEKNFPEVKEVDVCSQIELVKYFVSVGQRYSMKIKSCLEPEYLKTYGVDTSGCMNQNVLERVLGTNLIIPSTVSKARECGCLLNYDIGTYNTCLHGCKYCYANYDRKIVEQNYQKHDPQSPLLIGQVGKGDKIVEANQSSWIDPQIRLL